MKNPIANWPKKLISAIGSLPFEDPGAAVDLIARTLPDAPHWPQLPRISFLETMEHQYLEGLPCFRIDEEKRKCYFDTSGDNTKELEKFYEQYLDATAGGEAEHFAISNKFAAGIEPFVNWLDKNDNQPVCLKGQVTGPITAGLGLTDQDGRSIFYDDIFADIIVKGMALKGYWNAVLFSKYTDFILIFMDEPVLSGFGSSAFITVSRDIVIEKIDAPAIFHPFPLLIEVKIINRLKIIAIPRPVA